MTEWLPVVSMFILGGVIAAAWLLALWVDVNRLADQRRPWRRMAAGAAVRLAIVAAGFYLVIRSGPHWQGIAAALLGFLAIRSLALWLVRRHDRPMPADSGESA